MSFTDPDDVYATCTAAADLIERHGLHRRSFWGPDIYSSGPMYRPGMPMCTLGAIRVATGSYNTEERTPRWPTCLATVAVREEIAARLDIDPEIASVAAWSDVQNAATVVSLLRDVAAKNQPDEFRSGGPQ